MANLTVGTRTYLGVLPDTDDIDVLSRLEAVYDNYSDMDYPETNFLEVFHEWFLGVHGYVSIVVCVFGVFTNIFNITVLMAKDMRTATNHLLTFLAVSDILTMLPYIPYAIRFYCPFSSPLEAPWKYSYSWILYMVIMVHWLATTHTISIWLAVALAAFRFSQIRSPCPSGPLTKDRRITQVKIATAVIYVASALVLIPNYMSSEIELTRLPSQNVTTYRIKDLKLDSPKIELVVLTNILTYAILAKLLPCLLILVFSGSLLYHMDVKANRRRQRLSSNRQQANTTRMLLVVLILFIFSELPQGMMLLLSATMRGFYGMIYSPLGDLIDFVSLLNNAINFLLYCVMSQQFRNKFFIIYIKPICDRRRYIVTSTSEVFNLREIAPRTLTTTTHEDTVRT